MRYKYLNKNSKYIVYFTEESLKSFSNIRYSIQKINLN